MNAYLMKRNAGGFSFAANFSSRNSCLGGGTRGIDRTIRHCPQWPKREPPAKQTECADLSSSSNAAAGDYFSSSRTFSLRKQEKKRLSAVLRATEYLFVQNIALKLVLEHRGVPN